jgi:hypothetical protein
MEASPAPDTRDRQAAAAQASFTGLPAQPSWPGLSKPPRHPDLTKKSVVARGGWHPRNV